MQDRKSRSEFSRNRSRKDGLQHRCRVCYNDTRKARSGGRYDSVRAANYYKSNKADILTRRQKVYDTNRKRLSIYLDDKCCIDCGEDDKIVLQFDHVRGSKRNDVSALMSGRTWETIMIEIDKCEIRCANCHVRVTAKRAGWNK